MTPEPSAQKFAPWICPCCGHFIVRREGASSARHCCNGSTDAVELIPYIDAAQAIGIRTAERGQDAV